MLRQSMVVLVATCMQLSSPGVSAQAYPSHPVTIVVPYGPGGNADLAARSLAIVAPKYLGQKIIVTNRAGAGGMIGSRFVVDAPNDGYTLLLARVGSQAVAPALDPAVTYKWDDFSFLGMLEIDPYVCVVDAKSPLHSFDDLTRALKANPGKTELRIDGKLRRQRRVSDQDPVRILDSRQTPQSRCHTSPAAETITSVMSGTTNFACNGISPYTGNMRAGNLRGLVVSTPDRVAEVPDVPTAKEVGMPDLEVVSGWSALYGPPDLPKEVIDRWVAVLGKLKADPEWTRQPTKRWFDPRHHVTSGNARHRREAVQGLQSPGADDGPQVDVSPAVWGHGSHRTACRSRPGCTGCVGNDREPKAASRWLIAGERCAMAGMRRAARP